MKEEVVNTDALIKHYRKDIDGLKCRPAEHEAMIEFGEGDRNVTSIREKRIRIAKSNVLVVSLTVLTFGLMVHTTDIPWNYRRGHDHQERRIFVAAVGVRSFGKRMGIRDATRQCPEDVHARRELADGVDFLFLARGAGGGHRWLENDWFFLCGGVKTNWRMHVRPRVPVALSQKGGSDSKNRCI
jgi:hypothetical protein